MRKKPYRFRSGYKHHDEVIDILIQAVIIPVNVAEDRCITLVPRVGQEDTWHSRSLVVLC